MSTVAPDDDAAATPLGFEQEPSASSAETASDSGAARPAPAPAASPRLINFVFTDLTASAIAWEACPDAMASFMAQHATLARRIASRRGGTIFQAPGDSVCMAFADDAADDEGTRSELSAAAAVHAARDYLGGLSALGWSGECARPTARVAVTRGLVRFAAPQDAAVYHGAPLNLAGRLLEAAQPGQIVCDEAVADALRQRDAELMRPAWLGRYRFRGIAEPVGIYQVARAEEEKGSDVGVLAEASPLNVPRYEAGAAMARSDSLIGRAAELELLMGLILDRRRRFVNITGPAGVGKTRLAAAVAERLRVERGLQVLSVMLAPLVSVSQAPLQAARALGGAMGDGAIEQCVDWQALAARLRAAFKSKPLLLLLDNCEHLAGRELRSGIETLLAELPALTILATSRQRLRAASETSFVLRPLATTRRGSAAAAGAPAAILLLDRARACNPQFGGSAGTADEGGSENDLERLTRRLGGLPLAIEIVAAWADVLPTPSAMLQRLQALAELPSRSPAGGEDVAHHESLTAAFDYSLSLLDEPERAALARLSLFADEFSLEDAEALSRAVAQSSGADADALAMLGMTLLDAVGRLADKSLVTPGASEAGRFVILPPIREHALRRLIAGQERAEIERAHAEYFAAKADEWHSLLYAPGEADALSWFRRFGGDYDAAVARMLSQGDAALVSRLALVCNDPFRDLGWQSRIAAWLSATMPTLRSSSEPNRVVSALCVLARNLAHMSAEQDALAAVGEALRISAQAGKPKLEYEAAKAADYVTYMASDFEASRAHAAHALALAREFAPEADLVGCLFNAAITECHLGNLDAAWSLCGEALRRSPPQRSAQQHYFAVALQGELLLAEKKYAESCSRLLEAIFGFQSVGANGHYRSTMVTLLEALAQWERHADCVVLIYCLTELESDFPSGLEERVRARVRLVEEQIGAERWAAMRNTARSSCASSEQFLSSLRNQLMQLSPTPAAKP